MQVWRYEIGSSHLHHQLGLPQVVPHELQLEREQQRVHRAVDPRHGVRPRRRHAAEARDQRPRLLVAGCLEQQARQLLRDVLLKASPHEIVFDCLRDLA